MYRKARETGQSARPWSRDQETAECVTVAACRKGLARAMPGGTLGGDGCERGTRALLASVAGRADPVRFVPALLQARRWPAGVLLRAAERRWADDAHHVRSRVRFLPRPDREEAARSFLSRYERPLVRHCRLQPRLPL